MQFTSQNIVFQKVWELKCRFGKVQWHFRNFVCSVDWLDLFNTSKHRFIGLFYFFYLDVGFGFYVGFGVIGSTCLEILPTGKWPSFFPNIKGLPQNGFGGNFFQPITWWLKKPCILLGYVWLNKKYFSTAKYFLGENNFSKI